jgi:hypothetical protein
MRFAFVASDTSIAQQSQRRLVERYGEVPTAEAEVIVALGGDGFMLRTLHTHRALEVPVYGMKLGRVGFLMNKHKLDGLPTRIERAHTASLFPLEMRVTDAKGGEHTALAFNEVSLLRQSNQAAHLEVQLNDTVKLATLVCDGILVSTPAGSTAYNLSSCACSIRASDRSAPPPIFTKCATCARCPYGNPAGRACVCCLIRSTTSNNASSMSNSPPNETCATQRGSTTLQRRHRPPLPQLRRAARVAARERSGLECATVDFFHPLAAARFIAPLTGIHAS